MESSLTIPYAAPVGWYVAWLGEQLDFAPRPDYPCVELNRCYVAGANGLQILSVPIRGGSRNLHRPYEEIEVSEHGSWRRVHWGAIFSAYGRTPYFEHYEHLLRPIWSHPWPGLSELNNEIHRIVSEIIFPSGMQLKIDDVLKRVTADYAFYWQIDSITNSFQPDLSVLDLIFSLGPQAIFHLLHPLIYQSTTTPK